MNALHLRRDLVREDRVEVLANDSGIERLSCLAALFLISGFIVEFSVTSKLSLELSAKVLLWSGVPVY